MNNNTTPRKFGPRHVPFTFLLALVTGGPVAQINGFDMADTVTGTFLVLCVVFSLVMDKGGRA